MHIICTHEQADFDAIASLLGMKLLERDAFAVLPRRLNRNVRAYLSFFGADLPFDTYEELPREKVERVTLVDTHNLPSLKGVTETTAVSIIDHHLQEAPAADGIERHVEAVGATTTLLVEGLQQQASDLNLEMATLLLLGIYEDTGSLTYASTTPRDVRAAAWLLECGANLNIAADFLNHPLSNGQRALFDRLLEAAETITMQGYSIVIASARAQGMVDEISTLAHKLRDIFDSDALFVLVGLDGSVQLVARSKSDRLDVGRVAEHFGGGGHSRAAAALIRERGPADVRAELVELLQEAIEPAQLVREIMSREPQLLSPDLSIEEAAQMMQRFGHEGYPVVEDGRVIGLLTRRAVDRAMTHGLADQPIERIMEAGSYAVRADDSIQHLQRQMIESGWGQLPVLDPGSGQIVAIVTRTDLLEALGAAVVPSGAQSLIEQLEAALPPARHALLKLVAARAEARGDALYIVGGFVRDLLLHIPSTDFDLVVEGDAIGLARSLADSYGGHVSSHRRFGTAKWRLALESPSLLEALGDGGKLAAALPTALDFVSARTEFYTHPTALPSIQRGSIKLDLHRRDFTINTLALRLDQPYYGQLLDPWGGGRDLREGLIRVLHSLSFMDDPTRILRAVRLKNRFGFRYESRTEQLMQQALSLLERVSGERIRHELEAIFRERNVRAALAELHERGVLAAIHPALAWDGWLAERFAHAEGFAPPDSWRLEEVPDADFLRYGLWLLRLEAGPARSVCSRLRFPAGMRDRILAANRLARWLTGAAPDQQPSEWVRHLDAYPESALVVVWLGLDEAAPARRPLERYLTTWRFVRPQTDGTRLKALGIPPGPAYADVLWKLRAAWLDGVVKDEASEAALLEDLLERVKPRG